MEILNVKVEKETMEKLDKLIRKKAYKNKSEAVREMLKEHFEEHPEFFGLDELEGILRDADGISDRQFEKLAARVFRGTKTAAQLVAQGRDR
jgi:Arc/MetJ-type ribon-helix-helix transcriptional regulator